METWVVLQACCNQDSASCTVKLWIRSPRVSGKWAVSWASSRSASKGILKVTAQSTLGSFRSLEAFTGTNWLGRVSGTASNEKEKFPSKASRVWALKASGGFQEPLPFLRIKPQRLNCGFAATPKLWLKAELSFPSLARVVRNWKHPARQELNCLKNVRVITE